MDIPAHVAPARPPRRIGPIVAGSLMAGFVAALVLVLGPFAGAPENVISGTMLLAFAGGWALLAVLSLPGPSNPSGGQPRRPGSWRYFLSNKNTGWLTAARSNSSSEDSTLTPK